MSEPGLRQLKVLVFGSVEGRLAEAVAKANTINKSKNGPFDAVLFLGDAIGPDTSDDQVSEILSGKVVVDVPTYFSGSSRLHATVESAVGADGSVCKNLIYLGASGAIATSDGLRIACYGTETDATKSTPADILFGSAWPKGITRDTNGASVVSGFDKLDESTHAADIAKAATPRYHFVCPPGLTASWERPPYANSEDGTSHVTRFICLAPYGTPGAKWFYAFNIKAGEAPPSVNPLGTTRNPYEAPQTAEVSHDTDEVTSMLWNGGEGKRIREAPPANGDDNGSEAKRGRTGAGPIEQSSCFLCLSNVGADKSLIASIADESYLALAKGPLGPSETIKKLGCPGHVLIVPLVHAPVYSKIPQPSRDGCLLERHKYLVALRQMYADAGLACVSFEFGRSKGVHLHTQVVPVPDEAGDELELRFKEEAQRSGMRLDNRDLHDKDRDYLKISLPGDRGSLVASLRRGRVDLQVCRRVLASVLGVDAQADWRRCMQTTDEEAADCAAFRKLFGPYDFTS